MAACDYSCCADEEGRRQRGCSKHRLSSASPYATAGGRGQDSCEHSKGSEGGTWLAGVQLLPALGNLHRRVSRILLYLNKMTELKKWRADTELKGPRCSQSRKFFPGWGEEVGDRRESCEEVKRILLAGWERTLDRKKKWLSRVMTGEKH